MLFKRPELAARRRAAGHTQESLADHLRVDRSTVRRWEAEGTDPLPWVRPALAEALGVSLQELMRLLAPPAPPMLGSSAPQSAGDLVTVAELREQVHDLGVRYDRVPSAVLLADTGQCLGRVQILRDHADSAKVTRDLLAAEAEAATLMGQLVWDASQRNDHDAAKSYFNQAIDAARKIRDTAAEGQALLRLSFVALYGARDPAEGLRLTRDAAAVSEPVSDVISGLAHLHSAEAHAMLRERTECEQSLLHAERHLELADPRSDVAGDLFTPTQLGRVAGSCYLYLGDNKRAQTILAKTADALNDRKKSLSIVLGNLTLSCVRQGDVDGAADALDRAIQTLENTRGGGGMNLVFTAARELEPWRQEPVVQDTYDRLLGLMTGGVRRAP